MIKSCANLAILLLATLGAWAPGSARAAELSAGSTAPVTGNYSRKDGSDFSWLGKQYERCDQLCLINKADNVLSVAEFARDKRLTELISLYNAYKSEHTDDPKARPKAALKQNLGPYCVGGELEGFEGITTCFKRYAWAELTAMRKAAATLRDIGQAKRDLAGGKLAQDKAQAVARTALSLAESRPEYYQSAYVPTFDELNARFKSEGDQLRAMTTEQYARWQEEIVREPSCEEFVKTEKIQVEGRERVRVVTDAQGNPVLDDARCKQEKARHLARANDYKNDFENIGKTVTDEKNVPKPKDLNGAPNVSVDAYKSAQEEAVAKVKGKIKEESDKLRGPDRKLANKKIERPKDKDPKAWGNAKLDPVKSSDRLNVNELSYDQDIEDAISVLNGQVERAAP